MKYLAALLVLIFACAQPSFAFERGGGSGRPAGGGGGGGFKLNSDVSASRPQSRPQGGGGNANRPSGGGQNNRPNNGGNTNYSRPNNGGSNNRPNNGGNTNYNRNNGNTTNNYNRNGNNNINSNNNINVNRTVVANPVYGGSAWGWNHGTVWYPAGSYWGGGFWGAMAIGVTSAAVFGAIVNSSGQTVTSYQVQANSPGATLLTNYGLTQTQCGPPNLVVIYGPDNSVICAYPNQRVSAGSYTLDTSTLSLVSQ
ncbi:MAG: hypothetical protein JO347_09315 [Candidatus Eremiobacteraeota bacterium]|nr:hypothetical protein [Candidatus Eremiobacteraeota bacterium]